MVFGGPGVLEVSVFQVPDRSNWWGRPLTQGVGILDVTCSTAESTAEGRLNLFADVAYLFVLLRDLFPPLFFRQA